MACVPPAPFLSSTTIDMKLFSAPTLIALCTAAFFSLIPRMQAAEAEKDDLKFSARAREVVQASRAKSTEGKAAMLEEFEKGARALAKEFPKRAEPFAMLLEVAENSEPEKARKLLAEIIQISTGEVKEAAEGLFKKLEAVGKPLALKFKATDGRQVDLSKMQGKVVLVDFWATWCVPCVAELPNVKAAYEKFHGKGFEIVGISLDKDLEKLKKFTEEKKMAWAQYCDGKGWEGKYAAEFGITGIPTMWLVDKKGNLRHLEARDGLAEKVEKLLAEK